MKAIIMAGGEGTRLRPVSDRCPKPMVPLLGRPLLEHTLALLKRHGVREVCMTLRHMPEEITNYFQDGARFGMRVEYRIEKEPLGTAGGVRACSDFLVNEPVLIISGDAACDFDLTQLMREHDRTGSAVTMALYSAREPLQYGLVVTDRHSRVISFIEKPPWERVLTDLVNTGIYILSPKALFSIPQNTKYDFARDLFPALMKAGETLCGVRMDGYWCDIGSVDAYRRCCMDALRGELHLTPGPMQTDWAPDSFAGTAAHIGQGTDLLHSVVEDSAEIGEGCSISDSVALGKIGRGSVLRGAVVCSGAVVPPGSVLPPGSVIGACGAPAQAHESPQREPLRHMREIPCRSRASLMRVLTESLAEFGADFTDGLTFQDEKGSVRISPSSQKEAICIETDAKNDRIASELARKYENLAKKLGQNV